MSALRQQLSQPSAHQEQEASRQAAAYSELRQSLEGSEARCKSLQVRRGCGAGSMSALALRLLLCLNMALNKALNKAFLFNVAVATAGGERQAAAGVIDPGGVTRCAAGEARCTGSSTARRRSLGVPARGVGTRCRDA